MGDDNWQNSEEMAFIPEQVEPMLTSVLTAVLANEVYDEAKVANWVDLICDKSMETLTKLNKPFKYIGAYLHYAGRIKCCCSYLYHNTKKRCGHPHRSILFLGHKVLLQITHIRQLCSQ